MLSAGRLSMTVLLRSTSGDRSDSSLVPEALLPVIAVATIVGYADIRIPMGLPGHRGLVWLTLLVAVALVTRRRQTVIAVGAASTTATLMLHAEPWTSARYLVAAVVLCAVSAVPVVRHRPWLVALAAAPIHLVALAAPIAALIGGGYVPAVFSVGMGEKLLWHLAFGLMAGVLGWGVALGMGYTPQFGELKKESCHDIAGGSGGSGGDQRGRRSDYRPVGGCAYGGNADDHRSGAAGGRPGVCAGRSDVQCAGRPAYGGSSQGC